MLRKQKSAPPARRRARSRVGASSESHVRRVPPLGPNEKPDQLADRVDESENRKEALIDAGVEGSFPASDPPSGHHIT